MDFPHPGAVAYSLVDAPSGTRVAWAVSTDDLFDMLRSAYEEGPERFHVYEVIGLDAEGVTVTTWNAPTLLELAQHHSV